MLQYCFSLRTSAFAGEKRWNSGEVEFATGESLAPFAFKVITVSPKKHYTLTDQMPAYNEEDASRFRHLVG